MKLRYELSATVSVGLQLKGHSSTFPHRFTLSAPFYRFTFLRTARELNREM